MQQQVIANRYRLGRTLGKGSFGEVFQAEDTKFEPARPVALKLLRSELFEDEQVRNEIKREASILARFNHPNILRVIDFEVSPELAYIVTELAEGGSLEKKLRPDPAKPPAPIPLPEVAEILRQLADALDEAHALGLIHRDIKPLNILLTKRGTPLLADFGLASTLTGNTTSALIETSASGTPLYMAPELWNGQVGRVSDIYALGIVVYQMVAGVTPFSGNTQALAWQHARVPVPNLRDKASDLFYPPALDEVLAQALAKDPAQRIRKAGEFYRRFQEALDGANVPKIAGINHSPVATPLSAAAKAESAPPNPNKRQIDDLFYLLTQAETKQDWDKLIELGERILKLDNSHQQTREKTAVAYHMRGVNAWASGDFDRAVKAYNRAIELDDSVALYFERRGKTHYDRRNYDNALGDFTAALERDPGSSFALYWRGLSYFYLRYYEQAVKDFSLAIEIEPDKAEYYYYRGLSNKILDERLSAQRDLEQAANLRHHLARTELEKMAGEDAEAEKREQADQIAEMGMQMEQAETRFDWTAVIEIGRNILELEPDNRSVRSRMAYASKELALALGRAGNYSGALDYFNQTLQFEKKAAYYLERGRYLWKINRVEAALADFDKALELEPRNFDLLMERSVMHRQRGDQMQAVTDYNRSIQLKTDYHLENGNNAYLKGDYDRAINEYSTALQLSPTIAEAYYRRGVAQSQKKDYEQAMADYNQAVSFDPHQARYYFSRSICHSYKGDFARAVDDMTRTIQFEPNNPANYYWRGIYSKARRDKKAARIDFQRAAEMGHNDAREQLKLL